MTTLSGQNFHVSRSGQYLGQSFDVVLEQRSYKTITVRSREDLSNVIHDRKECLPSDLGVATSHCHAHGIGAFRQPNCCRIQSRLRFLLIIKKWLLSKHKTEDSFKYFMVALVTKVGTCELLESLKGGVTLCLQICRSISRVKKMR